MLSDFSSSLCVWFGAALLTLLTWLRWPKIRLQTQSQSCHGVRMTDVMMTVSDQDQRRPDFGTGTPKFEVAVYIVIKNRNR
jgi:hypothetical protein